MQLSYGSTRIPELASSAMPMSSRVFSRSVLKIASSLISLKLSNCSAIYTLYEGVMSTLHICECIYTNMHTYIPSSTRHHSCNCPSVLYVVVALA